MCSLVFVPLLALVKAATLVPLVSPSCLCSTRRQQLLTLAHLLPPDYRDAWLAMGRALAERRKRAADAGDQK